MDAHQLDGEDDIHSAAPPPWARMEFRGNAESHSLDSLVAVSNTGRAMSFILDPCLDVESEHGMTGLDKPKGQELRAIGRRPHP